LRRLSACNLCRDRRDMLEGALQPHSVVVLAGQNTGGLLRKAGWQELCATPAMKSCLRNCPSTTAVFITSSWFSHDFFRFEGLTSGCLKNARFRDAVRECKQVVAQPVEAEDDTLKVALVINSTGPHFPQCKKPRCWRIACTRASPWYYPTDSPLSPAPYQPAGTARVYREAPPYHCQPNSGGYRIQVCLCRDRRRRVSCYAETTVRCRPRGTQEMVADSGKKPGPEAASRRHEVIFTETE